MKVYITVLKAVGGFDINKITGVYTSRKAAGKAIEPPPGYRASGICFETIEEHEIKREAKND